MAAAMSPAMDVVATGTANNQQPDRVSCRNADNEAIIPDLDSSATIDTESRVSSGADFDEWMAEHATLEAEWEENVPAGCHASGESDSDEAADEDVDMRSAWAEAQREWAAARTEPRDSPDKSQASTVGVQTVASSDGDDAAHVNGMDTPENMLTAIRRQLRAIFDSANVPADARDKAVDDVICLVGGELDDIMDIAEQSLAECKQAHSSWNARESALNAQSQKHDSALAYMKAKSHQLELTVKALSISLERESKAHEATRKAFQAVRSANKESRAQLDERLHLTVLDSASVVAQLTQMKAKQRALINANRAMATKLAKAREAPQALAAPDKAAPRQSSAGRASPAAAKGDTALGADHLATSDIKPCGQHHTSPVELCLLASDSDCCDVVLRAGEHARRRRRRHGWD
ncbi:hypothetical protein LPJ61_004661 [Coemansia biformis]|uniref:Uncharacterized protein n=1 Tax=Coemansia biformis TaxID=1286918 RepID=A0A9W8CX15_9FUNG|nr:hypothetical protein LPJ61_004661 [Coemansia biformis]